jgi:predicted CDP-diglyceride synthetase/phosphatidate cytidylyltransferase
MGRDNEKSHPMDGFLRVADCGRLLRGHDGVLTLDRIGSVAP